MLKIRNGFQFWMPVHNYEGLYEISIIGVRSISRVVARGKGSLIVKEKLLKPVLLKIGYYTICFTKNNISIKFFYHRLISFHFIYNPKPERKFINHKNGIKTDIRIINLEWNTQAENNKHAYDTGLNNGDHKRVYRGKHVSAKKVGMYKDGLLVKEFECQLDAKDYSKTTVGYFIKNKREDPDGFIWKFI